MSINPPATVQKVDFILFHGGLDSESVPVTILPGFARSVQNWEEDNNGGYKTLTGYQAFDGQTEPHLATYTVLIATIPGTIAVGDTITGVTSAATGKVIAITSTTFVITKYSGTFVAESLTTGGAAIGGVSTSGTSRLLAAQYTNLAADAYRSDIAAVPGSGNILGVQYYKGTVYAFRNTVTTGVKMYKSTISGWQEVAFGYEVYFSSASGTQPAEGATITQGAVSGTLKRVCIESGTFAAGTAAGRLIFLTITSAPFTAAALTGGMTGTIVSQAAITIPNQSGRYKFVIANFTGSVDTIRMYGCDGANRGFEFDGTTFIPINNSGMGADDKPTNIAVHRNYLFFSYFGSVQYSGLGTPFNWTVISGANEIGASDTVTGFAVQPGSSTVATMAIYCRNRTYLLYGNDPTTWELINYSETTGAIDNSIQVIGQTYVMDDRGIESLTTAQEFGNFSDATISQRITSLLQTKRNLVTDSHIARDKQQYRVFFSDGSGIYCTLGKKIQSMMPVLFPNPVLCSCSAETSGGGEEVIFFGSSNGFVYQMERGTSFNGTEIDAFLYLVFNNLKTYRVINRYRRMSFEIVTDGYSEIELGYDLGYSSTEISQPGLETRVIDTTPPKWGEVKGGEFIWDGTPLTTMSLAVRGTGENIALKLLSNSDYFAPVKFSGMFLEYSPMRQKR
jgi:hypothetical protein